MNQSKRASSIVILLACVHLLAMGCSTYVASLQIKTILVGGPICSVTGIAAGISALYLRRLILAMACFAAPLLAITLFIAEAIFLKMGPDRAAQPFMIIFLLNQAISLPIILLQLRQIINQSGSERKQISLRALMVTTAIFAAVFALLRFLQENAEHGMLRLIALILLGLTIGGEGLFAYYALRYQKRVPEQPRDKNLEMNSDSKAFDVLS
ncbi:hypothetical protein DTL42_18950 [Bremerella cremea]|uniref:Lipoprotein n=1 Tax=Bremerella cremea TaxID=1031537 RepID=A0A368KPJ0_9BACT|nr:hypothetical protein [Bremerella cremea]RCS43237.1 hypothetical protein DTL42_18950 [Bremerella cremea]